MKIVDHIAVLVENLDVSQEWYETNCGAKLIFEDYKYKRMAMGNVTVALIDKEHYQYNHIGILVENYRDLPSDKGEVVHHRDGTTGCYVKDPDGNVVEFIYYSDKMRADIGIDK